MVTLAGWIKSVEWDQMQVTAIAHYETTRYYIAGSFTQEIDADPSADVFSLSSNGDDDFFLASINICPAVYSFSRGYSL